MNYIFVFVTLLHISIWLYVLLSFLNKKLAYYNLYYIIRFVYIVNMLPFHILCELEKSLEPETHQEKFDEIKKISIIGKLYDDWEKKLSKICFFNPLSPQGMLIFGAITSAYTLKN